MSRKAQTVYYCDGKDCEAEINPKETVLKVNTWIAVFVAAENQYHLGLFFHFCCHECSLVTLRKYSDRAIKIDPFLRDCVGN